MGHSKNVFAIVCISAMIICAMMPACKKEQAISAVPAITFDSIGPNPAKANLDTIRIIIWYQDGDGNLGQDSTTTKNLFITDSRTDSVTKLTIPQLAPAGYSGAIEGNLNIILPPQYLINGTDSAETAVYSIYVTDRAGNQSNTVKTTGLVIKR